MSRTNIDQRGGDQCRFNLCDILSCHCPYNCESDTQANLMFLGIVKLWENRGGVCGKLTQSMEALHRHCAHKTGIESTAIGVLARIMAQ